MAYKIVKRLGNAREDVFDGHSNKMVFNSREIAENRKELLQNDGLNAQMKYTYSVVPTKENA